MCSCPSYLRYRQTPLRERVYRTYLTPEDMPRREPIAYTTSESNNAQSSRMNFGEFQIKDNIAMLFLQNAYISLISGCKDTNNIRYMATFVLCFIVFSCMSNHCVLHPYAMRGTSSFVFARRKTAIDLFSGGDIGRCVYLPCGLCRFPLVIPYLFYIYPIVILLYIV